MLEGREIVIYGDGSQTRDFTYIDDIIEGLVRAPLAPAGSVMNLGGGHRVSLMEVIVALSRTSGVVPRLTRRAAEPGDVRDTWADIRLALKWLDYEPSVHLKSGLERQVAWMTTGCTALSSTPAPRSGAVRSNDNPGGTT